ncbi:GNAT family N-acetyltransferase [Flavihumibacter sp. R14]|nr:GNAT family N-acetyltransferase [Flavihumibacter soli]
MDHILDNPAWNAMLSFNSHLAIGNDEIRYFPEAVGPFAGLKDPGKESLMQLFDLLPAGRITATVTAAPLEIPSCWTILYEASLLQMTGENFSSPRYDQHEIVALGTEHVPLMISLTKLTNPGPFAERTIEFGNYTGIFKSGELVAMAGQRMHAFDYIEISAVCTHPDHAGKGYGRTLLAGQAERILSSESIPYLHVRKDNATAIRLYEQSGFRVRSEMMFYVLEKPEATSF